MRAAVFLDRDGVLIEDIHLLTRVSDMRVLPGVPDALRKLKAAGFELIVVSNQTVVSRGLATESEVCVINSRMQELLSNRGAPVLDAVYFCPHHPKATVAAYRIECDCRKPRPGLFLKAATDHKIDLNRSYAIGDRITDIIAGASAGCRTILVETGQHTAALIETSEPIDVSIRPDYTCANLLDAAHWILNR